jgi:branched-chain amino acid transport system permease protein
VSAQAPTAPGYDPRLGAGGGDRWRDRYLFWVPRPLRNVGVLAGVLFVLWVIAASGEDWSYLGSQLVAGLSLGTVAALAGTGLVVAYQATGVFNFALAGIATLSAFVMFELTSYHGFPTALAMIIVVFLFGPAIGAAMDVIVFRPLERRGAGTAEKLVANLGVLILLLGIGAVIYGEQLYQPKPVFSAGQAFQVGSGSSAVSVSWAVVDNLLVIVGAVGALTVLFRLTPIGRQVRAVVDRRSLAELSVVNSNRISMLSWAIGAGFAAIAGVLDAPFVGLQNGILALQVLQVIGVAVIAKLRGMWAAVAAGLGLGVVQSLGLALRHPQYPSWLPLFSVNERYITQLPVLSLLAFLLIYRTLDETGSGGTAGLVTASFGRRQQRSSAASAPMVVLAAVAVFVIARLLTGANLATAQQVVAYAITFLSIVAITGYSGHISLATSAFAGLGGYITERLTAGNLPLPYSTSIPHVPVILAMLIGGVLVIPLGVLIGYPALRRKGLILGLITLGFALIVNAYVFQSQGWFKGSIASSINRPHFFGLSLESEHSFMYYELVILGLMLLLVRNLSSGVLGRVLGAMRDSEKGAVSVGISLRRYKLFIFGASAFIAAIGGSVLAQQQQTLNLQPNGPLSPLSGLYWFGAVVVFGLSYRSGAILAAVLFVAVDVLTGKDQSSLIVIGFIALFIGYLPGGIIGTVSRLVRGDGTEASPMQRSLADFAIRQHEVVTAPPPGTGMRPSKFADRLLTGGRR